MTRKEKISAIYKEMANKELTFGCKLQVIESEGPIQGVVFNIVSESYKVLWDDRRISTETKNSDFSIIGHPVMIGDVLDWVSGRIFDATKGEEDFLIDDGVDDVVGYDYKLFSMRSKISSAVNIRWNYKRLPIEKQTDRCIDFIYSLIKK